jgi:hypothetical protein
VPWLGRLRPRGESPTNDRRSGMTRLLPRRPRSVAQRWPPPGPPKPPPRP